MAEAGRPARSRLLTALAWSIVALLAALAIGAVVFALYLAMSPSLLHAMVVIGLLVFLGLIMWAAVYLNLGNHYG
jgi:hypothetical protein